jgi:hypothetical protein
MYAQYSFGVIDDDCVQRNVRRLYQFHPKLSFDGFEVSGKTAGVGILNSHSGSWRLAVASEKRRALLVAQRH